MMKRAGAALFAGLMSVDHATAYPEAPHCSSIFRDLKKVNTASFKNASPSKFTINDELGGDCPLGRRWR